MEEHKTQGLPQSRDEFTRSLLQRKRPRAGFGWSRKRRVKRLICMSITPGETEVIPTADQSLVVRCARGHLWITHDSDPKDVILAASEVYRSERDDALRLHAMEPCVVEIEFDDEIDD